jgi:hypothetical protein
MVQSLAHNDIRQTEIHAADHLSPALQVEIFTGNCNKSGMNCHVKDQIPEILIQAGCKTLLRSIYLLILFGTIRTATTVIGVYYHTDL